MKKIHIALTAMAVTAMCVATLAIAGCNSHAHTLESVAKEEATCTAAGHDAYYKCTDPECGKLFSDAEGKTEISAVPTIAAKGHNMEKHIGTPATCTADGTADYWTCKNEAATVYYANEQGTEKITDLTLKATGHKMTKHDAVAPTCEATGSKTYWTCDHEDQNILYADAEGNETTTLENLTVAKKEHTVVLVEKVPATCVSSGMGAYFTCHNCGKIYSDAAGQTEIKDKNSLVISKNDNHTGELTFGYASAPEANAEGDILKATCSECKRGTDIKYDAGETSHKDKSDPLVLETGKTFYVVNDPKSGNSYFGIVVNKVGTYTLSFTSVYRGTPATEGILSLLTVANSNYDTGSIGENVIVTGGRESSGVGGIAAKIKGTILTDGQPYDFANKPTNSFSFSFTIEEGDLSSGSLYIFINYSLNNRKSGDPVSSILCLLTLAESDNAQTANVKQVALLPSKEQE